MAVYNDADSDSDGNVDFTIRVEFVTGQDDSTQTVATSDRATITAFVLANRCCADICIQHVLRTE